MFVIFVIFETRKWTVQTSIPLDKTDEWMLCVRGALIDLLWIERVVFMHLCASCFLQRATFLGFCARHLDRRLHYLDFLLCIFLIMKFRLKVCR